MTLNGVMAIIFRYFTAFGSFWGPLRTGNSSGDEIANVNFLYDDIVHVLQNTIDSCIPPQIDAAVMCGTHVYQIQRKNAM